MDSVILRVNNASIGQQLSPNVVRKTRLLLTSLTMRRTFTYNMAKMDRGEGNFTAWANNQPNNFHEEDCVHALGVKYNYKWNDVNCSDCHQYTCKKGRVITFYLTF